MTFAPLDQSPVDQAQLSLASVNPPMSPDLAAIRAGQVSWAFEKPYGDTYSSLINGDEDYLRGQLASEETLNQNKQIADILRKNPFSVTPNALAGMIATKDPRDIVERKYADKAVNSLVDYTDNSLDEPATGIKDGAKADPTGMAEDMVSGKEAMSKNLLIKSVLQNMEDAYKNQSYGGWFVDQLKTLSMIYPEAKLRGQIPGTGMLTGGLLGENLAAQRQALIDMPYEQFKNTYLSLIDKLKNDNPSLALQFAQAMYGQSLTERTMANIWTPLAATDIYSVGSIAKGLIGRLLLRSGVRNVMDRGSAELAKGLDAVPPQVAVAEASGRVVDAALQQTVNRIVDQEATRITPERTASEGLMSVMRGDKDLAIANTPEHVQEVISGMERTLEFNAGSHDPDVITAMTELQKQLDEFKKANSLAVADPKLSRGIFDRLREQYENSFGAFMNATLGLQRVLRIGNVLADRKVLEQVWNEIKGRTMGLSDNVIDMTIPRPNRVTGNYDVMTIFGRNSSELFNDYQEAINIVENHGLRVVMVDGVPYGNVKAGESGVSIGNVGGKYYAAISRPVNEMEHYIRDAVVETAESKAGNHGILNQWGFPAWLRTPNEVLPQLETVNRTIAIYGPAALRDVLEKHVSSIVDKARAKLRGKTPTEIFKNLGKGSEFQRMLDDLQRGINPETGLPGRFLDTPQDVYAYYMTNFGRAPDLIEYEGYFAAKRGMAMDYSFRNMMLVKNMARLGNEEHRIYVKGLDGRVHSEWFVGADTKPVETALPSVPPGPPAKGFTRFYHSGEGASGGSRWLTPDYIYARDFRRGKTPNDVHYVDIENNHPLLHKSFDDTGTSQVAPYVSFEAPEDIAKRLRPYEVSTPSGDPRLQRTLTGEHEQPMDFRSVAMGGRTYTVATAAPKSTVKLGIPADAEIAYIGEHASETIIKSARSFELTKIGRDVIPKLKTGEYKLIKVYNTHLDPLNGFSGITDANRPQYVISKFTENRPLSFDQIPRQPGFHIQYEHPWYLKQADVRRSVTDTGAAYHWYEGDSTAFLLQNRLLGEDLSKIMNEVRDHLLNNRAAEAELAARKLPIGWKELKGWFEEKRGPGGVKIRPRFNLNEEFRVVPKGKMIRDLDNNLPERYKDKNFRDGTRTGSPAKQFQVEFTGQRDAHEVMEVSNKGTRFNPMYSYDPAQPLDPITSMNRALSSITNSTLMDDVKISSMQNWLQRNKGALDLRGLGDPELMSAPFYHFAEAKILSGVPKTTASRIEAERWMIKQFNGTPSVWDTTLAAVQDRMMDSIYGTGKWDPKHSAAVIGKWGVTAIKDGPAFLRYMAFKAGLGMFSLPQFFVQANTFVTIMGVAGPVKASQGAAAAMMHQWSRFNKNPAILRTMDKKLQAFGWKPGEFIEAYEAIKGTGFDYVSNETNSMFGYTKADSIFRSAGRSFLDMGDLPFKEGERFGRYGAWYTAFKEWRDANPIGRMTELDRGQILRRANDLAGNMTLADKSGLQTGALAFPTQFLGYSMRLTELMLGHRLDWKQKTRLFGTYWAFYGLPVAAGLSGVTYFGDSWKESVQKAGYTPNELSVAHLVNEGLPSAFLKLVTGNTYNVGERYGNPGLDVIRDFFAKDKTVLETYAGASGSMISGAWQGLDGYWKWVGSFLRAEDKAYGMTSSDFIQPFKTFASVNNAWRTEMAVNTGVWMSKNETPLKKDTGVMNAVFMSTTGLQPKDVDSQTLNRMQKTREELQKEGLNSFIRNIHRAMDAVANKDPQQANVYFNNAKADLNLSGYPDEKRNQAWDAALQGRTLPERQLWNYWMTNVNPEEKSTSADIYSNVMRNMK